MDPINASQKPASIFDVPVELMENIFTDTDLVDLLNFTLTCPEAKELPKFLSPHIDHLYIVHHWYTEMYYIAWETGKVFFRVDDRYYNEHFVTSGTTRILRNVSIGYNTMRGTLDDQAAIFHEIVCKSNEDQEKAFRNVVELVLKMTTPTSRIELHSGGPKKDNFFYMFDIVKKFHKLHILLPKDMTDDDLQFILENSCIEDLRIGGACEDLEYHGATKSTEFRVRDGIWLTGECLLNIESQQFYVEGTCFTGMDIKQFLENWKRGESSSNMTKMSISKNAKTRIRNYNSVLVRGFDAERWHAPFVFNDASCLSLKPEFTWCMRNVNDDLGMVEITPNTIKFVAWSSDELS